MTNLTNYREQAEDGSVKPATKSVSYNLYEAKTALSKLVEQAAAGEEIVIAKNGKPMAKLVAIEGRKRKKKRDWSTGRELFQVTYIAPDFDDPAWTDEELTEFGFL